MTQPPILIAGEALYDLVADGDGVIAGHAGGGPFNTARTIGRLGQPVAFLGRLSTDRLGVTLEGMLEQDGVSLDAVVRTSEPTTLALADVDADGAATYHFYEAGTSAPGLTIEAALHALPAEVAGLQVGTLGLVLEPLATALEAVVARLGSDTLVAVDPNCRPSAISDPAAYRERLGRVLERADVVKVSVDDLVWLEPQRSISEGTRSLLAAGPSVVLLTCGGEGARVITAAGEVHIEPTPVTVVDTIGAGDAFNGGFLAWWTSRRLGREELADGDLVVEAARFACAVAARTVQQAGATPPRLVHGSSEDALEVGSL